MSSTAGASALTCAASSAGRLGRRMTLPQHDGHQQRSGDRARRHQREAAPPGRACRGRRHGSLARLVQARARTSTRCAAHSLQAPCARCVQIPTVVLAADSYVQIPELRAQCLHGAKVMCLDAALRATHREWPSRQRPAPRACAAKTPAAAAGGSSPSAFSRAPIAWSSSRRCGRLRFEARRLGDRIRLLVVLVAAKRQPGDDAAAHRAPALHVADTILEYAVEQWPPLFRRAGPRTARASCSIASCTASCASSSCRSARLGDFECLELDAGQELVQRTGSGLVRGIRQVHVAV